MNKLKIITSFILSVGLLIFKAAQKKMMSIRYNQIPLLRSLLSNRPASFSSLSAEKFLTKYSAPQEIFYIPPSGSNYSISSRYSTESLLKGYCENESDYDQYTDIQSEPRSTLKFSIRSSLQSIYYLWNDKEIIISNWSSLFEHIRNIDQSIVEGEPIADCDRICFDKLPNIVQNIFKMKSAFLDIIPDENKQKLKK